MFFWNIWNKKSKYEIAIFFLAKKARKNKKAKLLLYSCYNGFPYTERLLKSTKKSKIKKVLRKKIK